MRCKTGTATNSRGRTPWSAADAPVGLLALCMVLISLARQRDGGVPRGPGGSAPPSAQSASPVGFDNWALLLRRPVERPPLQPVHLLT
jgi:hypothetical protein